MQYNGEIKHHSLSRKFKRLVKIKSFIMIELSTFFTYFLAHFYSNSIMIEKNFDLIIQIRSVHNIFLTKILYHSMTSNIKSFMQEKKMQN